MWWSWLYSPNCNSLLAVGSLTRVNPLVIHVYWFGQKVYGCLKVLQTYSALDSGRIFALVHFHLTAFLVITKWTCEHHVQSLDGFVLWWRLSLGFSASHSFVLWSKTMLKWSFDAEIFQPWLPNRRTYVILQKRKCDKFVYYPSSKNTNIQSFINGLCFSVTA